jgi:hypothetical protein
MMDVSENAIEQRCSALSGAINDTRKPPFRSAVIIGKNVPDAVRVQQKVIARIDWHDRCSPRRGHQHR